MPLPSSNHLLLDGEPAWSAFLASISTSLPRRGNALTCGYPRSSIDSGRTLAAMPQPPTLTPEQREAALQKAAEARRARAELKERLKMGSLTLSELLDRAPTDDHVGKMKVLAVLEALPGVGKVKARRTMEEIGIADTRRVRGLGDNQRNALLAAFKS